MWVEQRVYPVSTNLSIKTSGFWEEIETPFSCGTVVGGGIHDLTTISARWSAFQPALISYFTDSEAELREASRNEWSESNFPSSPSREAKSDKDEDEEDEMEVKYRTLSEEVLCNDTGCCYVTKY